MSHVHSGSPVRRVFESIGEGAGVDGVNDVPDEKSAKINSNGASHLLPV
jgi:hypothetical protein